MRIVAVAIQRSYTNLFEGVYIPSAQKHPHLLTFLLELHTAAPVWSGPIQTARKNPWIHPIQGNGLKQHTNWMHTGHVEHTEQPITTNQDLVAWPRDIHVDTNGRQSELRPETVDELIASTQHFNEGGNLSHHPQIRVHNTSLVNKDVFWEKVLSVYHDQRSPHDPFTLALYLCWTHDVPLIVKHFPAWRLQPQTLIARKLFAALEVPQNLVMTMSQHRNVLATNSAVKMTGFCHYICGPSHKESPNFTRSPSSLHLVHLLGTKSPPWLTSITLVTTRVSGITQPRNSTQWPLFHLLQSTQIVI